MSATILEIFEARVNESSARAALRRLVEQEWQPLSWKEWFEASERIAAGLINLGIEPNDRVAILAETRTEWPIFDIGIMMAGAVTVPIYPSLESRPVAEILEDSGARCAVVADPGQLRKVVSHRGALPGLEHVVWMDAERVSRRSDLRAADEVRVSDVLDPEDPWNRSVEDLAASGRRALSEDTLYVARRRRSVSSQDLATIVYTSGTTGAPRGVMLTHANLVAQIETLTRLEIFASDDVQYLFLPLAHIFARVLEFAAIGYGIETVLAEDLRHLVAEMQENEPTFFAAVPQIFEQVRAKVENDAARGALRSTLFRAAEEVGRIAERSRGGSGPSMLDRMRRRVLDELSPGRVRTMFGGSVRFAVSGGAPLSPDTAEFFAAFGVDILEGYGLTETAAVATLNLPSERRLGSVGRPLPGVDVTIDEDGEVLVRGPSVSPGYWRDEAATRESRDEDGWFRTGDIGEFDRDGFLYITGRKKELIVTSGGKNVAPAAVEAALESIPVVQRAFVFGDRRPYLVALLVLDPTRLAAWGAEHGLDAEIGASGPFQRWLSERVSEANATLAGYASVRRWLIVDEPFSEANEEVTPTGKLRRDAIAARRVHALDALYTSER